MPLCQIILLTRSHMPANQHHPNYQKLAAGLVLVGWQMASCKQDDLEKWHFLLFLWHVLIFWSQKGWFIELNLVSLGSDAVWILTRWLVQCCPMTLANDGNVIFFSIWPLSTRCSKLNFLKVSNVFKLTFWRWKKIAKWHNGLEIEKKVAKWVLNIMKY